MGNPLLGLAILSGCTGCTAWHRGSHWGSSPVPPAAGSGQSVTPSLGTGVCKGWIQHAQGVLPPTLP